MDIRSWGVVQLIECLPSMHKPMYVIPQHVINWVWWCMLVIPGFRHYRQEQQVNLTDVVSSKLA